MARPTKPKDVKPKTLEPVPGGSGGGGGGEGAKGPNIILLALIITLCSALSSVGAVYFIAPMVIKPLLANLAPAKDGEGGDAEAPADQGPPKETIGPVIDLEEFTLNLKDPNGDRYLRADLSIMVTANDPAFHELTGEKLTAWEEEFNHEMAHYVPSIRDIVIESLTKRTAEELSTPEGKQRVKDEIKRNIDGLFQGTHTVIRVNFENFIIQ